MLVRCTANNFLSSQSTQPQSVKGVGEWIPNSFSLIALEYSLRLELDEKDKCLEKLPCAKDVCWPDRDGKCVPENDNGRISHSTAISRYLVDWITSFSQSRPIQVFLAKKLKGQNPPWHFPTGRTRTQPPRGPRTRSQSQKSNKSSRSSPYPVRRPPSNQASPVTPTSSRPLVDNSDASLVVNPPNFPQSPALSSPLFPLATDGCINPAQLTTPTSVNEGFTTGTTPLASFTSDMDTGALSVIDPALYSESAINLAQEVNPGHGHGPALPLRETEHIDDAFFGEFLYISDEERKDNTKTKAAKK